MTKKHFAFVGFAWALASASVFADPLVIFPQGDFSCTVEVTAHNVPPVDPTHPNRQYLPVLKGMSIIQVGKVRRDLIAWSNNTVSQVWTLADQGVSISQSNDDPKDVHLLRGELRNQAIPRLLHFDAESVSWMTDKTLDKGSQTGGTLHYQATVVVGQSFGGAPPPTKLYQAWIDAKTLLPLKFDDEDALYVLKFSGSVPTVPPVMPPEVQDELQLWLVSSAPHRRL